MKAQAEIIVFILLLVIGLILFSSATIWSRGIFQENADFSKMEMAEKFMKDLDGGVSSVIKFSGVKEIDFTIDGTIEILGPKTIEVRTPISLDLQQNWINISEKGSYIMERKESNDLVLRLVYPDTAYKVFFFTDDSSLTQPDYIRIEKDSTSTDTVTVIKIKISFV